MAKLSKRERKRRKEQQRQRRQKQEQHPSQTPLAANTATASTPSNTSTSSNARKHSRKVIAVLLGIVSFASAVASFYTMRPKLGVSSVASLNPRNPFESAFLIKNDGHMPACNIHCFSHVFRAVDVYQTVYVGNEVGHRRSWDKLSADDALTVEFEVIGAPSPLEAEIAVIINYSPPLLPWWRVERSFFYKGKRSKDGQFTWLQQPAPASLKELRKYIYSSTMRSKVPN